ncbi:MAG: 16S rRNA (guanine(966)-N(2))-methyltransferase RsmD [Eubacterium sp.]|nr:16S rRNA (guanine(966)-N(2))-methyltransferase RsmD [Eubacterium sp.]
MRVISGSKRGAALKAPEGLSTRPTTDRIKESLFNILAPDLKDCVFLDLFSGSGGMGIEALSRGGSLSVFVDKDKKALSCIKQNISKTGFEDKSLVLASDYKQALRTLAAKGIKADIIFADPPYYSDFIENILDEIEISGILNNEGLIVIEQAKDEPEVKSAGFFLYRIKDYGKTTKMSFFKKAGLKTEEEKEC